MMRAATLAARDAKLGFTLIEILMAATAAAVILAAIYGVFSRAVRLRDDATTRTHAAQLRSRAAAVLRNDLRNGFISLASLKATSALAGTLEGSLQGQRSRFPGHLRLTTTTATGTEEMPLGDVQEVEYSIADDPEGAGGGVLLRTVDQDLTAPLREPTREERLLTGVASLEVSFYDGSTWIDSWDQATSGAEPPVAVRVRIQESAPVGRNEVARPPIEVLAAWTVQPEAT